MNTERTKESGTDDRTQMLSPGEDHNKARTLLNQSPPQQSESSKPSEMCELERPLDMKPRGNFGLVNKAEPPKNFEEDEAAGGEDYDGELKIPRQHARMDSLLSQIPKKAQHGLLMQCDLILTCIDANEYYIALGTNIGLTFLYSRRDQSMQRLKTETSSDVITCITLHHGVDHQLAIGMASGTLCIFLIPSFISVHRKQLQKFDVRSVHRHYITCVEWSTNGMKLFSGDKTGHVVTTEVDFYQGQCKSSLLLVEPPMEVVQLNYDHKVLLVSTKQRSFICRLDTTKETVQVGQQERKVQGNFGACFIPALCKVEDALLYAVRPGCRVWLSDISGTVCNTHIFKDSISSGVRDVPILQPSKHTVNPNAELQFGRLLVYRDKQLITHNTTTLFVLDPQMNRVVASQNRLGGIVDVAVHKDEVFVLRRYNDDAVIRIADDPEVFCPKALPFDLPMSVSATATTTTTTTTVTTTSTTATPENTPAEKQDAKEESKTKAFFKKTFFSPLKKLDNFIQEHTHQSKETHTQPPQNLNPVIKSSSENSSAKASPVSSRRGSQDSSPDLPPVVPLDSPDLAVRVFTGGKKGSGTPVDIQSPDSAHSALSVFAEEVGEKEGTGLSPMSEGAPGAPGVRVEVTAPEEGDGATQGQAHQLPISDDMGMSGNTADGSNDIVFSHHMHKKKAKKKKPKGKVNEKGSDNTSLSSFNSQISEEPKGEGAGSDNKGSNGEGLDDILQRADEALSSVSSLLTGDSTHTVNKDEQMQTEIPSSEIEVTAEDSAAQKDEDQIDSARQTASSETLVNESSSVVEVGDRLAGNGANSVPVEDAKNKEESERMTVESQTNNMTPVTTVSPPGNTTLQPSCDISFQPSSSTVVQSSGDTKPQPPCDTRSHSSMTNIQSSDETKGQSSAVLKALPSSVISQEEEDPLIAAEKNLDNMTRYHKLPVRKEDSVDDFYSKFSAPYSPTDPFESPSWTAGEERSLSDVDSETPSASRQISNVSTGSESEKSVPEAMVHKLANSWSEFTTPANIYSLGLSSSHIWFTDKSENLWYSLLGGAKGIVWRKVKEPANQISVSPSGHIVWRLYRGRVFAGTKITQRRPEGLKWVEAVRDVAHISVDDNCAWYVKVNGDVMMQRGLSKERPCFRSISVESKCSVKQVMARHGVVWAISDTMKLMVRTGISNNVPQGLDWEEISRESENARADERDEEESAEWWLGTTVRKFLSYGLPLKHGGHNSIHSEPYLFSSVSIDNEGVGWAVDVLGQIWFTDAVSPQTPVGSGCWWQVPLSEYFVQDPSVMDMIRSIARKFDPHKLSQILTTHRGGLIVAGIQGVWLNLDYLNTLHVCRSSLQGYHWSLAQPSQMASATIWKQVQASVADLEWGKIWAQRVNGELFTIPSDSSDAALIDSPVFVSYGVNQHAVWGLTSEGEVFIRTGMGAHCPHGVDWAPLELTQLGDIFLVHLSCNSSYVWVVDSDGLVFHRIGAAAPRPGQLNPVWLPIDTYSEIVFTKVVNGPVEWMVWAIDNRRLTYVRVGISEDLPIGKEWVHVPGIQAMDISLSTSGVWALSTNGEILFRYGITDDDVSGNYWKKIPGCFTRISASSKDVLWAVNTTGQLMKCSSRHLFRRQDSADPLLQHTISSTGSEEGDWELV